MSEQRLNIELVKDIREKIATVPQSYDQRRYCRRETSAPCGSAACIAGWACVLSGAMTLEDLARHESQSEHYVIFETARTELSLESDEAYSLFTDSPHLNGGWPMPFRDSWKVAALDTRPQVAVAYLDHIIATGKVLD